MTELEAALVEFLPRQRWFAGKGRIVVEVRTEASVPLRTPLPSLHLIVVEVAFADGGQERYALPVDQDQLTARRQFHRGQLPAEGKKFHRGKHHGPDGAVGVQHRTSKTQ